MQRRRDREVRCGVRAVSAMLGALAVARCATAQTSAPSPAAAATAGDREAVLSAYWNGRMRAAEAAIEARAAAITNREALEAWQQELQRRYAEALGPMPERTPLNVKVTRVIERPNYRVENLLFESRPRHYVTASLVLPSPDRHRPPYPAVIVPCGHANHPRTVQSNYVRACVMAAWNGIAALIYDPIDQGERLQRLVEGEKAEYGVAGHNRLGPLAILLGWNTATFRVWDGVRALDLLSERPDVDAQRLGCMGQSGGGTLSSLLLAYDSRIRAAAPSCYISTLPRVYEAIGPQDAEQNIFAQMAFGLDHPEFLYVRAPVPVLVCAKTQDFFPIDGTHRALARARAVLERLGWGERVALVEDAGQHEWSEAHLRETTRWMNRWLRGAEGLEVPPETEFGPPGAELQVTAEGQVLRLPGARSVYDIVREEAAAQAARRPNRTAAELAEVVRRRARIRPLAAIPPVRAERGATGTSAPEQLQLQREDGLWLPAWLWSGRGGAAEPVLLVDDRGAAAARERAEPLAAEGRTVLAVALRGFGELARSRKFYRSPWSDEADAITAYVLGSSLVGERAEDLLAAARWLAEICGVASVRVEARGWAATPALHAAVVEPALISRLVLRDRPPGWREVIEAGARHSFADVVHGAWADYELTTLEQALGERLDRR
ncbi:MAG: acetylxylan esterase [Kiritimatiellae bacterium]|nr:acetylxylan esterase [Kiritimatiellia bacterium]